MSLEAIKAQIDLSVLEQVDVRVGTIGQRAGVPVDVDQWQWSCGFYPGLQGMAPSAGLDRTQICHVGLRRKVAVANSVLDGDVPVW